jgi:hypothetical protein
MKRALAYFCFALGVSWSISVSARAQTAAPRPDSATTQSANELPTVEQIIERASLASGGKTVWSKITSMRLRGTVEIPAAHMTGVFESYSQVPNKSYESVTLGGVIAIKQVCDGTSAWRMTPAGVVELQGEELEIARRDADFYGAINLKQRYAHLTFEGESTIGGQASYKVVAPPEHGKTKAFYFDKDSGLRIGMSTESTEGAKPVRTEQYFEDFQTVQGIRVPFTIHIVTPAVTMVVHLRDVQANAPILNSTFMNPAGKTEGGPQISNAAVKTAPPVTSEGGISGSTYTSSTFGFTYTFPAGWVAHGESTEEQISKVGRELMAGDDPGRKAAYDAANTRSAHLLTVFQYPMGTPVKSNPSIQIMAERVDSAPGAVTARDYLRNLEAVLKKSTVPLEIADNLAELTIGGKQFFRMDSDMHFPTALVHQSILSTKLENFVLSFVLTAGSAEELQQLRGTLDSLNFAPPSR